MESFLNSFSAVFANEISFIFSCLIAGYFVIGIFIVLLNFKNPRLLVLADMAPSMLTSMGILGTFLGIFIGLQDFNYNIDTSLPKLLDGLKIAFGTSILGLSSALTFRFIRPIIARGEVSQEVGADEIYQQMVEMNKNSKELITVISRSEETTKDGLETLRKALTDDSDSSISGQLQRLRASISDLEKITQRGFEEQVKEFKEFAEHMSKAFSEAIIDELKSVIREFNEKISEQFGDNFKQLNEAVGKLVEWQENYRVQMEQLKSSLDSSVAAIEKTQGSIESIEQSTSKIPEHMEKLSEASQKIETTINSLEEGILAVAAMREKAENAFPTISDKIEEIMSTLKDGLELQQQNITKLSETLQNSVSTQTASQEELLNGLQNSFNTTMGQVSDNLNDSVVKLDEAMQQEIGKVVNTMAENLSGVVQQFVADYTPLLEQSRKIVEMSQEANK